MPSVRRRQRRLEEEEVLEELLRRSEWTAFAHSWEDAHVTVESTFDSALLSTLALALRD